MSGAAGMAVDIALEAAHELVRVYQRSASISSDLAQAEQWLLAVVQDQEKRAAFLECLAAARNRDELPEQGYQRILDTMARLLSGNVGLVSECERITRR